MAKTKTALVTGGAGFIGSHLVDRLLSLEYKVVIVDNLSTGKLKNLNPGATFHHLDITHASASEVFQREEPDLVFHLAAQVSVTHSTKDPIKDGEINVLGTLRLLEACRRYGPEKFIYSSTGGRRTKHGGADRLYRTGDYGQAHGSKLAQSQLFADGFRHRG